MCFNSSVIGNFITCDHGAEPNESGDTFFTETPKYNGNTYFHTHIPNNDKSNKI